MINAGQMPPQMGTFTPTETSTPLQPASVGDWFHQHFRARRGSAHGLIAAFGCLTLLLANTPPAASTGRLPRSVLADNTRSPPVATRYGKGLLGCATVLVILALQFIPK